MITSENMEFAKWLAAELEERGWNQADLCRASGLSSALVSRILTGMQKPGPRACKSIARALGYSIETVYKMAGLLPRSGMKEKKRELLEFLTEQLDDEEYKDLVEYIEFRLSKSKK